MKSEHLAEELADVILCVVLVAIALDIDLEHITAAKFNATSIKNNLKTMIGAGDVVFNGEENDQ